MVKNIADGIQERISNQALNQENTTRLALTALLAGGHVLLIGQTGIGKTQWARTFAGALSVGYNSIRFTENNQPYEIFGAHEFDNEGRRGALYSQVLQCDEIANANSNVHTALMDMMEHGKPIGGGHDPFFVIATDTDTYTLPEALVDRFMMKLNLGYPGVAAEKQILQMHNDSTAFHAPPIICTPQDVAAARQEVQAVAVEDAIFNYIISIVETTRRVGAVITGASPRGSIALMLAAKAHAAIMGRDYVIADDVRRLAVPVLRHRIKLKRDAIQEGMQPDHIIEGIIKG